MPEFSLQKVDFPVQAVRKTYLLLVDGKSPFAKFEKTMRKAGKTRDLQKVAGLLQSFALGKEIPPNACKELRGVSAEDDWR